MRRDARLRSGTSGPAPYTFTLSIFRSMTATWFALAILYFAEPRGLPEPMVALLVGTTIGLASGLVKGATTSDQGSPAVVGREVGVAGTPRPSPDQRYPLLTTERPPASAAPATVATTPPLDLDSYERADPLELQCPRCGRFTTEREPGSGPVFARCHTCRERWRIDDPSAAPDVVVRSWLSTSPPSSA